jgi:hypothetical protein
MGRPRNDVLTPARPVVKFAEALGLSVEFYGYTGSKCQHYYRFYVVSKDGVELAEIDTGAISPFLTGYRIALETTGNLPG